MEGSQKGNKKGKEKNWVQTIAQNIKNDKKSFYAYVRNKAKVKPKVGLLAADNGEIVDDSTKMADEFNKFFSSVFTDKDTTNTPTADVFPGVVEWHNHQS